MSTFSVDREMETFLYLLKKATFTEILWNMRPLPTSVGCLPSH